MQNVKLGGREAVTVFVEIGTKRVLGFCPENARPLFPPHIRYTEYTLLHARDIERWVGRYREQQERDAVEATARQIESESIFRKSLRSAIRERNQHVSPINRDLNNVLIRLMDERYDKMMASKMKPVVHGMAEGAEASKSAADFAIESPAYRKQLDPRVTGGAVMRDIDKIEHDRTQ